MSWGEADRVAERIRSAKAPRPRPWASGEKPRSTDPYDKAVEEAAQALRDAEAMPKVQLEDYHREVRRAEDARRAGRESARHAQPDLSDHTEELSQLTDNLQRAIAARNAPRR